MSKFALLTASLFSGVSVLAADRVLHSFERLTLTTEFWSEGAGSGDFNRDGKLDVVSGPYWYAGPDFQKRHEFYLATQTHTNKGNGGPVVRRGWSPRVYSDNFFAFAHDFNSDRWPDILVIGFPGKDASWFENPRGQNGAWKRHVVFDAVDNESPHWIDLTGDGKPELVCNHNGHFGYAQPDWENPGAKWSFHPISPKGAWGPYPIGMEYGKYIADARVVFLVRGGWWGQTPPHAA
jgi:hypothetical protein